MKYVEICNEYFKVFSNKDISKLSEMFEDASVLRDWNKTFNGKQEVIKENKNIFDSVETIQALPKFQASTISHELGIATVFNEIDVVINGGEETLFVIDIIDIDLETNLIKSVRAYKG